VSRRRRIGLSLMTSGLLGLAAFASSGAAGGAAVVITHGVRVASQGPALSSSASATWSSSNWSGYAETGTFTSVSGSWTVPTVSPGAVTTTRGRFGGSSTTAWYSATWLGIDGFNDSNLIQTGTEQDYYGGAAHYSAWWEILPAAETVISEPVNPGDVMTATITKTPTQVTVGGGGFGRGHSTTEYKWTITITDETQNPSWTFQTTQAYGGAGTSAEWIVEAPEVNGQIASLAKYLFPSTSALAGDFNSAEVATLGGSLGGAGLSYSADAGTLVQNNAQVSTPGPPDGAATAFNSLYGATAPAPPQN
jgi:Peptidase A4 family